MSRLCASIVANLLSFQTLAALARFFVFCCFSYTLSKFWASLDDLMSSFGVWIWGNLALKADVSQTSWRLTPSKSYLNCSINVAAGVDTANIISPISVSFPTNLQAVFLLPWRILCLSCGSISKICVLSFSACDCRGLVFVWLPENQWPDWGKSPSYIISSSFEVEPLTGFHSL